MAPWVQSLGGVGFFLFGMALMTSGLRKIAGERLRRWLGRSTRTTVSGVVTGAAMTAVIQSSSATTLAAIGFVGAGLITFTQSLGIIFGANIGTTLKGWMIALLGFKLEINHLAMPLLFVAALLYLINSSRLARGTGKALAGFCLVFIGLDYLQGGLEGFRDVIDLSQWRGDSIGGRLILLFAGIALTLVTQSSSVTVAAALTALNTGIVDLPQAAAVIIGADIGTTATAALATIGGSTATLRTGFAHVIYNLLTGAVAFAILPLFLFGVEKLAPGVSQQSPEMVAAAFHSFFNVLGVLMILPFTASFARMIERIFPETESPLCAAFDRQLLASPETATAALTLGSRRMAAAVLTQAAIALNPGLGRRQGIKPEGLPEIFEAVRRGRDFAVQIGPRGTEEGLFDTAQIFDCIHIIDHVGRLAERVADKQRAESARSHKDLRKKAEEISRLFLEMTAEISGEGLSEKSLEAVTQAAENLENDKPGFRQGLIKQAAAGQLAGDELDAVLDAQRWLRRIAYHAARIAHYAEGEKSL